jgi:hypothetical protein
MTNIAIQGVEHLEGAEHRQHCIVGTSGKEFLEIPVINILEFKNLVL